MLKALLKFGRRGPEDALANVSPQDRWLDACLGCLLGGAAGDALGYPVEFQSEDAIRKKYGRSGIRTLAQALEAADASVAPVSDDTQMTLFAANGLIYAHDHGTPLRQALWTAYREWLGTQEDMGPAGAPDAPAMFVFRDPRMHHRRAPGGTCLRAVRNTEGEGTPARPVNSSKGCGTVMRAAPFGLTARGGDASRRMELLVRAFNQATADAALTHGHPMGYLSSAALAVMVCEAVCFRDRHAGLSALVRSVIALLEGDGLPFAQEREEELPFRGMLCEGLKKAVRLAGSGGMADLKAIHALGEGWTAEEALYIAVFCALRHENDFAAALAAAVNHKGDSDSTGAVCGNLLGAWLGRRRVEAAVDLENLEMKDLIERVGGELYRVAWE